MGPVRGCVPTPMACEIRRIDLPAPSPSPALALNTDTHLRITSLAAFSTPALALWLPSGYAYGTALLLVGALFAAPHWLRQPIAPAARWLLAAFVVMALVWLHGSDWSKGVSVLNKPVRYILAVPCLLYALRFPPRASWLVTGIAIGAASGGLRALYDVGVLDMGRPWQTHGSASNAIQLGNLSGLFGLMCWLQAMVHWPRWRWPLRLGMLACCALGLLGLLLSQTRGGWLALALCVPVLLGLLAWRVSASRAVVAVAALCVLLLPMVLKMGPKIEQRVNWALNEVSAYDQSGEANTSVGQRLDHWQLAWAMGQDRPLLGWGDAQYAHEKERRVAIGQADPAVVAYGHTHNELLDQFVKRGLIGVLGLLFLYLVPLALFWPRRAKAGHPATTDSGGDECGLRLIGVAVPLAYMGFGLTQVFFAHYNGVVIYLDLAIFIFAALSVRRPDTPLK